MLQTSEIFCHVNVWSQGWEIRFYLLFRRKQSEVEFLLILYVTDGFKILTFFLHSNEPAAVTTLRSLRPRLLRLLSYSNCLLECQAKLPGKQVDSQNLVCATLNLPNRPKRSTPPTTNPPTPALYSLHKNLLSLGCSKIPSLFWTGLTAKLFKC